MAVLRIQHGPPRHPTTPIPQDGDQRQGGLSPQTADKSGRAM